MLCAKCHHHEATIHLTTVVDGVVNETVHLCRECAPPEIQNEPDLKAPQGWQDIGKCEFCRQTTSIRFVGSSGTIYCCQDCGYELGRILMDLYTQERPDLLPKIQPLSLFTSISSDPEVKAWLETINQKAMKILKERKCQGGHDQGR